MAIDRPLQTPDGPNPFSSSEGEVEIEIVNPESVSIETPDGGVLLDFDSDPSMDEIPHDANLAEYIEDSDLSSISQDLISSYKLLGTGRVAFFTPCLLNRSYVSSPKLYKKYFQQAAQSKQVLLAQ